MTAATETTKRKASPNRRGNGEGTIFQRADGYWIASLSNGSNAAGRRKRLTITGKTKKAVQDKLTKLQNSKLDGTLPDAGREKLSSFLDRWLEDVVRLTTRSTTHASYKSVAEKYIGKHVGGVLLSKLTPAHVQAMYSSMEKAGKSARMRQLTHAVLRRALRQALRWGLVVRNVCDAVEPPRVVRKTITPLTTEQAGAFLKAATGKRLEALFVLAVTTGLRQGELFALKWPDIDLEGGTVTVRHTLVELNGKLTLGEPKSAKSRRLVEMPDIAVEALIDHRKRMLAEGHAGSDWAFCDSRGGPLRKSNLIRNDFKPLLTVAGLPNIRFHDLRHTSATLLLSAGVHPKIVQERLGHSQIGLTMDTYSHVMPGMGRDAATKMDGLLRVAAG